MCNAGCVGYDTAPMAQSTSRFWRYLPAVAALTAGAAAVATLGAQSGGTWWPGYSGGADNSRYFPSRQINRSNVSQLQVAWTYPYGDTSFAPVAVRGAIYGRGRNGSLVAVDRGIQDQHSLHRTDGDPRVHQVGRPARR